MSSPQPSKVGIASLLSSTGSSSSNLVSPALKDVGKLAASVATLGTSTSLIGNSRSKCALTPGHSLMDWIRLGASGKDLTGVGNEAGRLTVSLKELAKHNKLQDAWLAIRGIVYNVTAYLPFHPGGPEELMRGVGTDATELFEEIHSWVNYQSILQKCCVGRLVPSTTSKLALLEHLMTETESVSSDQNDETPNHDWFQEMKSITSVFYTTPMANPAIELTKSEETVTLSLNYSNRTYVNEISYAKETLWPPSEVVMNYESGKLECLFKKMQSDIWDDFGVLNQSVKEPCPNPSVCHFKIVEKIQLAKNVFVIKLRSKEHAVMVVPLGYHVRVYDGKISRCYTPIPNLFSTVKSHNTCEIHLMVKRYEEGNVSKTICDSLNGDVLTISKPLFGGFNLEKIGKYQSFLMLAAGTGITPMFSLIFFLLERRVNSCHWLRLIFANKSQDDIPFNLKFQEIALNDIRFKYEHVLSQPKEGWVGKTGHVTTELIEENLNKSDSFLPKNFMYFFVCGPVGFNRTCVALLKDLKVQKEQIHVFQE